MIGETLVAVVGAGGKLGRVVTSVIAETPGFTVCAELGRESSLSMLCDAELVFDVSHHEASPVIVQHALRAGADVIIGTSGWSAARLEAVTVALGESPQRSVLVVPNFSLGSVLGTTLAALAAPFFDAVEIVETHHPAKLDSPSGTAVRTAEVIAQARNGRPIDAPFAEQPARGETIAGVPVHSLRLAGVIAQQRVHFGGVGETLTISHDTVSPDSYRAGIRAALLGVREFPGLRVGLDSILGLGVSHQRGGAGA